MDSGRSFPWGLSQGKAKGNFLPDKKHNSEGRAGGLWTFLENREKRRGKRKAVFPFFIYL
ncbi:hypothetical protein EG359_22435 (plasmid) [Chryseobacterium joostei]|uniref:Uncharacterized protein n=1 Tax=Chryseobacterium joostei TaxID=112234 RepID=A0ABN5SKG7_9FLAO|nr:hypothetical protein EG359_22435 [Chryseobacterium joostei]